MTPIEAENLAAELREHMETLADLDTNPLRYATSIERHRRLAQECAMTLAGYLVASDNFSGVNA